MQHLMGQEPSSQSLKQENIGTHAQTHHPFDKQWKEVILHTLTLDDTEITSACTICSLIHGVYRVCVKCAAVKECKKPIKITDKVSKFQCKESPCLGLARPPDLTKVIIIIQIRWAPCLYYVLTLKIIHASATHSHILHNSVKHSSNIERREEVCLYLVMVLIMVSASLV